MGDVGNIEVMFCNQLIPQANFSKLNNFSSIHKNMSFPSTTHSKNVLKEV